MQPLRVGSSQGSDSNQSDLSADSSPKSVAPFFAGWSNRWKFDNAQFLPQNSRNLGKKTDSKKWWIVGATSLISAPLLIFGAYKGHKTGFFVSIRDAFKNWRQSIKAGKPYQSFDRVKVEKDHSALQAENARLRNENDEAVRAKNLAEQAKEALEREKAQLEGQRDLLAREKSTALADKESIAREKASLELSKNQTESALRASDQELQRLKLQLEANITQLRELEANQSAIRQKLVDETAGVSDKEGEVRRLAESLGKAEADLAALKEEKERLDLALNRKNPNLAKLEREKTELNSQLQGTQEQLESLEAKHRTELRAKEREISDLQGELKYESGQLQELRSKKRDLESEKAALQEEIALSNNKLSKSQNQVADLQAEKEDWEESLTSQYKLLKEKEAALTEANNSIKQLQERETRLNGQLTSLQAKFNELNANYRDLQIQQTEALQQKIATEDSVSARIQESEQSTTTASTSTGAAVRGSQPSTSASLHAEVPLSEFDWKFKDAIVNEEWEKFDQVIKELEIKKRQLANPGNKRSAQASFTKDMNEWCASAKSGILGFSQLADPRGGTLSPEIIAKMQQLFKHIQIDNDIKNNFNDRFNIDVFKEIPQLSQLHTELLDLRKKLLLEQETLLPDWTKREALVQDKMDNSIGTLTSILTGCNSGCKPGTRQEASNAIFFSALQSKQLTAQRLQPLLAQFKHACAVEGKDSKLEKEGLTSLLLACIKDIDRPYNDHQRPEISEFLNIMKLLAREGADLHLKNPKEAGNLSLTFTPGHTILHHAIGVREEGMARRVLAALLEGRSNDEVKEILTTPYAYTQNVGAIQEGHSPLEGQPESLGLNLFQHVLMVSRSNFITQKSSQELTEYLAAKAREVGLPGSDYINTPGENPLRLFNDQLAAIEDPRGNGILTTARERLKRIYGDGEGNRPLMPRNFNPSAGIDPAARGLFQSLESQRNRVARKVGENPNIDGERPIEQIQDFKEYERLLEMGATVSREKTPRLLGVFAGSTGFTHEQMERLLDNQAFGFTVHHTAPDGSTAFSSAVDGLRYCPKEDIHRVPDYLEKIQILAEHGALMHLQDLMDAIKANPQITYAHLSSYYDLLAGIGLGPNQIHEIRQYKWEQIPKPAQRRPRLGGATSSQSRTEWKPGMPPPHSSGYQYSYSKASGSQNTGGSRPEFNDFNAAAGSQAGGSQHTGGPTHQVFRSDKQRQIISDLNAFKLKVSNLTTETINADGKIISKSVKLDVPIVLDGDKIIDNHSLTTKTPTSLGTVIENSTYPSDIPGLNKLYAQRAFADEIRSMRKSSGQVYAKGKSIGAWDWDSKKFVELPTPPTQTNAADMLQQAEDYKKLGNFKDAFFEEMEWRDRK